ncbi:MAG TPA: DEDD exonuclease domain-containing protein [Acidimicrobiia bacterium]|jgi:DNA polymerase-3 subunit epsilon
MAVGLQRSFNDLGAPLFEVPFCVLDLETTGGSAASCEITEIGAVRFDGGEPDGVFHTLVNPGVPIPPMITVLTGITEVMLVEAPRIGEALPAFLEFLGPSVVVGHNVRFDLSFLDAAAVRLGYGRLPNRSVDTVGLARRLVRDEVRNLKLATLAAHFRSPVTPTHRALDDARATAHVFWELLGRAGTVGATHLDDLLRLPTARGAPHYRKIGLADGLPRRPGVYLFRRADGEILYVGKAKNLRTRVRSYFYGDDRKQIGQMLRDVDVVDHRECATELEAEVAELRLIHAHRPRYNRRSRPARTCYWVKLTAERFPRLSMVRTLRSDDGCCYLGPYRSRRQAELVVTAIWDAAPIRRCLTRGGRLSTACHFAQLGVALCPCDGTVDDAAYQAVVAQVRAGIEEAPHLLLEPLADKMRRYAREERFEEAAAMRDRYRALAATIEARQSWNAMEQAGAVWAESEAGEGAFVQHGRLAAAWQAPDPTPLFRLDAVEHTPTQVPPSVALAEEARLVWRWLAGGSVHVIDATGPLAMPAAAVPPLETLAG